MGYSRDQIYTAMRNADKAGDGDAVRALAAQLDQPDSATPAATSKATADWNGKHVEFDVPAGATDAQIRAAAASATKAPAGAQYNITHAGGAIKVTPQRTIGDYAGLAGRAVMKGVSQLGSITDALNGQGIASAITGAPTGGQLAEASMSHLADIAGAPVPSTDNERLASSAISGIISAAAALPMGGGFALRPLAQLASGGLSGVSGEYARQQGAGPGVQTLAALAGGAAPFAPGIVNMPSATADAVRAAGQRLGVRPTPATVGGPLARVSQLAMGNIPGSDAAVSGAVSRETGDLAAAARGTAAKLGTVSTPEGAGKAITKGAQAYKRATGAQGNKIYTARDDLMGGPNAPVLLASTKNEITSFAQQFPNTPILGAMMEHPAVRKLLSALPDGAQPEVTVSEATDALSHIRGALRNAMRSNTVTSSVKARVAKVEQALEDDVNRAAQGADAIAGRTGNGAVEAQSNADALWSQRSRTLQGPLGKAMDSAADPSKVSAESVYRQMTTDMNREGGNHARLTQAWAALPSGAKRTFSATAFDNMGRATPGAQNPEATGWSFNTFLTNYSKQAPEARKLIFGGRGADQQIEDIAQYANRIKVIDRSRNFSNTARAGLAGALFTVIGRSLWHGDVSGAAEQAAAIPAMYGAGKLFISTPAMRAWTAKAMHSMAAKAPEPAIRTLVNRLPVIAASNPQIRDEVMQLSRAINDNIAHSAAADSKKQEDAQQQGALQ